MLAISAARQMNIQFFDVTTAFLNGKLEERVVMKQPDGYDDGSGRVCLLRRSLYGLKQASRCWNTEFVDVIEAAGMRQSIHEPCVFVKPGEKMLILGIYVDDGVVIADEKEDIVKLLEVLKRRFHMKTHGGDQFLGMEIRVMEDGRITVGQEAYAERVVERYNMQSSFPVSVPLDRNHVACLSYNSRSTQFPFRSAVGSLLYLAQCTRPDLAYAVGVAGRHVETPTRADAAQLKRALKYVKGTKDMVLEFPGEEIDLTGYSDADYAGCSETRKSTSGYVFMVAGGCVSWRSARQRIVAQSTAEAEYVSAAEAAKEMVWLRRLLEEMIGEGRIKKPILYVDNQSAIKMIENESMHRHAKHIDVRYHFIQRFVRKGEFIVKYIPSAEQLADILTKPLPKDKHENDRKKLGVVKM